MIMKSRVGLLVAGVLAAALPSIAFGAVSVSVGSASGKPGDVVTVGVTVNIDGGDVVGSLDITTAWQDQKVSIPAKGSSTTNADCTEVAEATLAQFKFVPTGCTVGTDCTGVRAAILGVEGGYNTTTLFYNCNVKIDATAAAGEYQITVPAAKYAKLDGTEIAITGTPGTVTVAVDTPVPTATETPVPPTATHTLPPPTVTQTPQPTLTRTFTTIPTRTPTSLPASGDDGCQMGPNNSSSLLFLLLPVAFAAVLRRRNR